MRLIKKVFPFLGVLFVVAVASVQAEARIVNRGVKENPKVCGYMKEDKYLSKHGKWIFGTLRNSLVLEEKISIVNDLGKKLCQWNFEKFQSFVELTPYSDFTRFKFYIDEYKNYLYSALPRGGEQGYTAIKISLSTCEIEGSEEVARFEPKCSRQPATKKRLPSKTRTASASS